MQETENQNIPYGPIADALEAGEVVPFLGAGASAVYRPHEHWQEGKNFLPFGTELAQYLASKGGFPDPQASEDLPLVASYYEHVAADRHRLRQRLRKVFGIDCRPGSVHHLLASELQPLLIITTNYDDLMECAFHQNKKRYHLVVDRGEKTRVWISSASGNFKPVRSSELRKALQPEDQTIIYKLHGYCDRKNPDNDRYLITEQDYVDFLGRARTCIPPYLAQKMANNSFLFLGYSLVDWNVRTLLRKLRKEDKKQPVTLRSWAISWNPGKADKKIWEAHGVNMYSIDLKEFIERLANELGIALDEQPA